MLIFNEQQQHAIVGLSIANAPIVKQLRSERLGFGITDGSQSHQEDISLVADGAKCCVDGHLGAVGEIAIRVGDVDVVTLHAGVGNCAHRPYLLGRSRQHGQQGKQQ